MKFSQGIWGLFFFLAIGIGMKLEDHLIDLTPTIKNVPTSRKVVALTFDDGPLKTTTSEILGILKEKGIKATFFVVGERVERFPTLVQQEIEDGHEVGTHTYSHPNLTKLRKSQLEEELNKTEKVILTVAPKPTLFRPPGGSYNDKIINLARDNGYLTILWSIDTQDWRYPPVGNIVNSVLKDIKPGSIILLHDGISPSSTPEALEFIIDSLRSLGYEFVTVSELLQYYETKP
ncbi:polysaccharide deacetylase family protein [Pelosinus sp. UFO1]|uniref:polysaccharide deacetylase family protein n=1 Tax=Pelosinus sp. UFO1 TaxID=484770 RepID=UPI0004D10F7B|nr:polysaccharide deacetylase family protein [Pelosinus sp. UFO1]AIF50190.1 polysaccharide deacetylase [Pelosinus sp. UFO1]